MEIIEAEGALRLLGVVQGSGRGARGAVSVGVDIWDYRPITLDDVARRARAMKPHAHWGDAEHGAEMD